MYLAHEAPPASLRQKIEGRRAIHSARHVFGSQSRAAAAGADPTEGRIGNAAAADLLPDAEHPIVATHPFSGRKVVYVNPGFTTRIGGLEEDASCDLLAELFVHSLNPAFVEEFAWEPGSVAIWDNRATWHFARNDYQGYRREMHRITIAPAEMQCCRLKIAFGKGEGADHAPRARNSPHARDLLINHLKTDGC